jgi:hypothetical protein
MTTQLEPLTDNVQHRETRGGAILFEINSIVVVKRDHIRGVPNNGPFFIGSVITNVTDEEHASYFDIEVYVSSFEDCLQSTSHGNVKVHRDAVLGTVNAGHFTKKGSSVKLSEMAYETFLTKLNDIEDLLPEGE